MNDNPERFVFHHTAYSVRYFVCSNNQINRVVTILSLVGDGSAMDYIFFRRQMQGEDVILGRSAEPVPLISSGSCIEVLFAQK